MQTSDLATLLDAAARTATPIAQLSESGVALSLAQAYEVQAASVARRLGRGEQLLGIKMGFTSRAKMQQMGVDDLIWGRLTDAMRIRRGVPLRLSHFIHPRAEPEIAFRLAHPLGGSVSLAQARAAVDGVSVAIEVIDSRYRDFRFSLSDVVADNSSSSAFVVGEWVDPLCLGEEALPITLSVDGVVVQQGDSRAILGNPWQSLVEAARLAAAAELPLQPGWIVLAGAATAAEALRPGVVVRADAGALGSTGFSVAAAREDQS
jgi:2-oxo-3-hexenedioate decarboxylase